jgi:hypothetical protein
LQRCWEESACSSKNQKKCINFFISIKKWIFATVRTTQPETQQLKSASSDCRCGERERKKGRKTGGSANGGARNSPRSDALSTLRITTKFASRQLIPTGEVSSAGCAAFVFSIPPTQTRTSFRVE